jgi:hypothetical protein
MTGFNNSRRTYFGQLLKQTLRLAKGLAKTAHKKRDFWSTNLF